MVSSVSFSGSSAYLDSDDESLHGGPPPPPNTHVVRPRTPPVFESLHQPLSKISVVAGQAKPAIILPLPVRVGERSVPFLSNVLVEHTLRKMREGHEVEACRLVHDLDVLLAFHDMGWDDAYAQARDISFDSMRSLFREHGLKRGSPACSSSDLASISRSATYQHLSNPKVGITVVQNRSIQIKLTQFLTAQYPEQMQALEQENIDLQNAIALGETAPDTVPVEFADIVTKKYPSQWPNWEKDYQARATRDEVYALVNSWVNQSDGMCDLVYSGAVTLKQAEFAIRAVWRVYTKIYEDEIKTDLIQSVTDVICNPELLRPHVMEELKDLPQPLHNLAISQKMVDFMATHDLHDELMDSIQTSPHFKLLLMAMELVKTLPNTILETPILEARAPLETSYQAEVLMHVMEEFNYSSSQSTRIFFRLTKLVDSLPDLQERFDAKRELWLFCHKCLAYYQDDCLKPGVISPDATRSVFNSIVMVMDDLLDNPSVDSQDETEEFLGWDDEHEPYVNFDAFGSQKINLAHIDTLLNQLHDLTVKLPESERGAAITQLTELRQQLLENAPLRDQDSGTSRFSGSQ